MIQVKIKVIQSCLTLCDPMDCILQARILEWVAIPFSRGSSQPSDWTQIQLNLLIKQKEINRLRKWTYGCWRKWWELWEGHIYTATCKTDNWQASTVQHMGLCSMLCASLDGVWGRMGTYVCMAESLCCSPETTTTLLIGYTPMQNVFGVKNNKN